MRCLIQLDIYQKHDLFDSYLKIMLSNTDSVLYYEMKSIGYADTNLNYYIPTSNKFLAHVIDNAKNAEDLHAYKPVGEYIISYLDDIYK